MIEADDAHRLAYEVQQSNVDIRMAKGIYAVRTSSAAEGQTGVYVGISW